MKERPSGAIAMPSSSVGPDVICSGSPFGNRCRQMWKRPPALELMYIHFPSGDHAANVHPAPGGPTRRPCELPSMGTTRHGTHGAASISTTSAHLPSGDGYERCAMPVSRAGTYTSRDRARLSSAVTIAMCSPSLISENKIRCLSIHTKPDAFVSHRRGSPPRTGTTHVSQPFA